MVQSNSLTDSQSNSGKAESDLSKHDCSSLLKYWSALENIEKQYQSLQKAREDAAWYRAKMEQANNLCESNGLNSFTSKENDKDQLKSSSHSFTQEKMSVAIEKLENLLGSFSETKANAKNSIGKFESESKQELKNLKDQLKKLRENLSEALHSLDASEQRINSLKTAQVIRVAILASAFFLIVIGTNSLIFAAIVTALVFWFL